MHRLLATLLFEQTGPPRADDNTFRWDGLLFSAIFFSSLAFFIYSLAPDVLGGDSGEFQFVPHVLGIPHQTGYPLYTLLGKAWSLIPVGTMAYRMNLLSAVFGALSVGLVYLILRKVNIRRCASIVAAASLAMSGTFLTWSTTAGVRSLTALLFALVIYVALAWWQEARYGESLAAEHKLFLLLFLFGLSLTHHRSAIFLAPSLLLLAVTTRPQTLLRPGVIAKGAVACLLPLLLYAYLPLRSNATPAFDQFHPNTLDGFLDLVLAISYSRSLVSFGWEEMSTRLPLVAADWVQQFGIWGTGLALVGALALLLRVPRLILLLAFPFTLSMAFTLLWNQGDVAQNLARYPAPESIILAVLIGGGISGLQGFVQGRSRPYLPATAVRGLSLAVLGVFSIIVLSASAGKVAGRTTAEAAPLNAFRQNLSSPDLRRLVMTSLPYIESNAVIISDWEQATAYWYVQLVEGINNKVTIAYPSDWEAEIAKASGDPVYAVRTSPALAGKKLTMDGSIVKVLAQPERKSRNDLVKIDANLGDKLKLLGFVFLNRQGERTPEYDATADVLPVVIYWQALAKMDRDYSVSVRLLDQKGNLAAQYDNRHPVLSSYPTSSWDIGEVVGDYYELPLAKLPAGIYSLEVVVYASSGAQWENLAVVDPEPIRGRESVILTAPIASASNFTGR